METETASSSAQAHSATADDVSALIASDPVFFAHEVLGIKPLSRDQIAMLRAMAVPGARLCVHSCHSSGKSFAAAILGVWWLYSSYWAGQRAKLITTASVGRTVETVLWPEMRSIRRHARIHLPGDWLPRKPEARVGPDVFALGFATDDIHAIRGHHSPRLLVIGDEAAGIHPDVYTGIEGLVTGEDNRILLISQPGAAVGAFWERCTRWPSMQISALTQENYVADDIVIPGLVSRVWVDQMRRDYGEDSIEWQTLIEGRFIDQAINAVITLQWVAEAEQRPPRPGPVVVLACDVAYDEHGDESVILEMHGDTVVSMHSKRGRELEELCGLLVKRYRELQRVGHQEISVIVDDTGVGHGLTRMLIMENIPVLRFVAAQAPWYQGRESKAPDKRRMIFKNRRAEAWWLLRETGFRAGKLILSPGLPRDGRLKQQLVTTTYEVLPSGMIQITPKEKLRREGIASPDRADALVMAWYARSLPMPAFEDPKKRRRDLVSTSEQWRTMIGASRFNR